MKPAAQAALLAQAGVYRLDTSSPTSTGLQSAVVNSEAPSVLARGGHATELLSMVTAQSRTPLPETTSCGHDCCPPARTPTTGEKRASAAAGTAQNPVVLSHETDVG